MAAITHDAKLNDLLVDLGRSLLQYAGESWPWAPAAEATAEGEVRGLAAQQRENVSQLADLLADRGWPIDFGGYPTDYTDLHFLSLDFFLPRLAAAQAAVVGELDEAVHSCIDDPAAVELLRDVLTGERDIAERLNALVSRLQTPSAV
ncbi:MAG: hypothetical protein SH850_03235 [Planctomycetaceae bacterium]|nr:hypothetical protein [Planctomycetaceae bacterium]